MKEKLIKQPIEPEILKKTMRTWITGVTIVTGSHDGQIHGMTANSFNSIALDPPTVLVALQHHARTERLVHESGFFGVTILDTNQTELAKRFAGQIDPDKPRFEGVDTFTLTSDSPLIRGGLAFLDCQTVKEFVVGSTIVFVGEVIAARVNQQESHTPLLYFNRQWRKLQDV
jgi:flavin reductase (DIM6/NTAB) family NADH-FMN oxidoreductase RutF